MTHVEAVVVGAGPGGLAAAAALLARGVETLVVDRSPHVGSSWRTHYDRLRLHTPRRWSGLPGHPIPRRFGRWVARDDVVRYLEEYAAHHRIPLRLGCAVARIDRGDSGTTDRWVVRLEDSSTIEAAHVVVATGYNHTPVTPEWSGMAGFTGEVVLAKDYRNGRPYAGRDVLVVGTGNTGTEIATDLAEHGATRVWLSVRTPPHIVPRSRLGVPAQATGILVRRLPPRVVDRLAGALAGVQEPDLTAYGMPRPASDVYSRVLVGRVPVQDVGVVQAIRSRRVEPVAGCGLPRPRRGRAGGRSPPAPGRRRRRHGLPGRARAARGPSRSPRPTRNARGARCPRAGRNPGAVVHGVPEPHLGDAP